MEKLKPCPFCGAKAQMIKEINGFNDGFDYFVLCDNLECENRTSPHEASDKAIAAWNTRTSSKGGGMK